MWLGLVTVGGPGNLVAAIEEVPPELPHDKALAVLEHLAEECGVRQNVRLVGVNKDTVTRLALLAGNHAKATHDELVAFSPQGPRSPVR